MQVLKCCERRVNERRKPRSQVDAFAPVGTSTKYYQRAAQCDVTTSLDMLGSTASKLTPSCSATLLLCKCSYITSLTSLEKYMRAADSLCLDFSSAADIRFGLPDGRFQASTELMSMKFLGTRQILKTTVKGQVCLGCEYYITLLVTGFYLLHMIDLIIKHAMQ